MTRHVTRATIWDAEHFTDEQRQQQIEQYPEHEQEARIKGIPALGSGRVYPIDEARIRCDPIPIPEHWARIGGLDFGGSGSEGHPTAAVDIAWDRDADVMHITKAYRVKGEVIAVHGAALKAWNLPVWAWPMDGLQHDRTAGKQFKVLFEEAGLELTPEHSQFPDKSVSVEAGIAGLYERMRTERFKAFSTIDVFWEEFRFYHRKDGLIVKRDDDIMDAVRIGYMMLRKAEVPQSRSFDMSTPASSGSWMGH